MLQYFWITYNILLEKCAFVNTLSRKIIIFFYIILIINQPIFMNKFALFLHAYKINF